MTSVEKSSAPIHLLTNDTGCVDRMSTNDYRKQRPFDRLGEFRFVTNRSSVLVGDERMKMEAKEFMHSAIQLSNEKMSDGTGGYCASLIVKNGEIVGRGWNNVVQQHDPTGHCEINAMRDAGRQLKSWDLSGCELYTTWEPCPMCVAAIWWARIDRVYYANLLSDAANLGMDIDGVVQEVRLPIEARSRPYERLLGDEALAVVTSWWEIANPELIA